MNTHRHLDFSARIGNVIRFIRISKSYKQEYIAYKCGYLNKSTYSKTEHGRIQHLDISKFVKICDTFEIEPHKIILLSEQEIFRFAINSWHELIQNIRINGIENSSQVIKLIESIFPSEFEIYKTHLT